MAETGHFKPFVNHIILKKISSQFIIFGLLLNPNMNTKKYTPDNKVRIVTAAALFDGHDAAINIMRRVIQWNRM